MFFYNIRWNQYTNNDRLARIYGRENESQGYENFQTDYESQCYSFNLHSFSESKLVHILPSNYIQHIEFENE